MSYHFSVGLKMILLVLKDEWLVLKEIRQLSLLLACFSKVFVGFVVLVNLVIEFECFIVIFFNPVVGFDAFLFIFEELVNIFEVKNT